MTPSRGRLGALARRRLLLAKLVERCGERWLYSTRLLFLRGQRDFASMLRRLSAFQNDKNRRTARK